MKLKSLKKTVKIKNLLTLKTSELIQESFHISAGTVQEKSVERVNICLGKNSIVQLLLTKKKIINRGKKKKKNRKHILYIHIYPKEIKDNE